MIVLNYCKSLALVKKKVTTFYNCIESDKKNKKIGPTDSYF